MFQERVGLLCFRTFRAYFAGHCYWPTNLASMTENHTILNCLRVALIMYLRRGWCYPSSASEVMQTKRLDGVATTVVECTRAAVV